MKSVSFVYLNKADASDPINILRVMGIKLFGIYVMITWTTISYKSVRLKCGRIRPGEKVGHPQAARARLYYR